MRVPSAPPLLCLIRRSRSLRIVQMPGKPALTRAMLATALFTRSRPTPAVAGRSIRPGLQEADGIALQHGGCEPARHEGSRVDIDAIWAKLRFPDRRMPVHDDGAEIGGA